MTLSDTIDHSTIPHAVVIFRLSVLDATAFVADQEINFSPCMTELRVQTRNLNEYYNRRKDRSTE